MFVETETCSQNYVLFTMYWWCAVIELSTFLIMQILLLQSGLWHSNCYRYKKEKKRK
jgi:hypothetical protein